MSSHKFCLFAGVVLLTIGGVANAAMIPDAIPVVTGWAFSPGDSGNPGDGSISRALNGSGLTIADTSNPSTWTHNNRWQDNWQGYGSYSSTAPSTPGAWLVMDLQKTYDPFSYQMYVWNVREVLDRGTQNVDIYYATSLTVMPATGAAYNFASDGWTLLGNYTVPKATGGGTPADAVIDLRNIPLARYIGLRINSNYGSISRVGFSEIEFRYVPEPSAAALLGLGGAGLMACLWRRRRTPKSGPWPADPGGCGRSG
jgi:hypothetical protein